MNRSPDLCTTRKLLLSWYDRHARKLPWRKDQDPYKIWISEIMLQQTRVETVIPYFHRFLEAAPDVFALAKLEQTRLFKLWEGLGYYNRAKHLHKAARIVALQYGGKFPTDANGWHALPGIGPYTAGAIASIAFGQPVPAADGNVYRVTARFIAEQGDITKATVKNSLYAFLCTWIPKNRVGDFNQALMELGALVCMPTRILCQHCPLNGHCAAHLEDCAHELPRRQKRKKRTIEQRTVFVLVDEQDRTALFKRDESGLLPGLWEFTNVQGYKSEASAGEYLKQSGLDVLDMKTLKKVSHIFTHKEWHMIGYRAKVKNKEIEGAVWVNQKQLDGEYAMPSAFDAYRRQVWESKQTSK